MASITAPRRTMVAVSPCATPSSMIAAFNVGRYSNASVLITCRSITATTDSSPRYGRTYCRSSARSIPLLSHTRLTQLCLAATALSCKIKSRSIGMSVVEVLGCRYSAWRDPEHVRDRLSRRRETRRALAVAAAAMIPVFAACSDSEPTSPEVPQTSAPQQNAAHGPFFPQCGGVSDQTMSELTRVTGLVNTATTSVGCQWLVGGGILGPHFSFTWYPRQPNRPGAQDRGTLASERGRHQHRRPRRVHRRR